MIDPFSDEYNFERDVIKNIEKYLVKRHSYESANIYRKQYDWIGTDDEKTFNIHYEYYPDILQYYVDNPISYNINNHFCRCDFDFEKDKTLKVDIFLGCSHTFGMGLHEKHIWWNKITEYTNNTPINIGVGGCSMEEQFMRLARVIDYFDVQNVIWFAPHFYRYTYTNGDMIRTFNINEYISNVQNITKTLGITTKFEKKVLNQKTINSILNIKNNTSINEIKPFSDVS